MTSQIAPNPLTFAPQTQRESLSVGRVPAAPGAAVQRFELLMYSPVSPGSGASVATTSALERSGLRHYVEGLSRRWEAGQAALKRMTDAGEYTAKELIQTQIQMINCALDVEVSSKCASTFENGVQTLVQRGS
jgi:hypothetical protein